METPDSHFFPYRAINQTDGKEIDRLQNFSELVLSVEIFQERGDIITYQSKELEEKVEACLPKSDYFQIPI